MQHTKKIIFLAFLLSLLFHSSSVIIVFFEKNKQQSLLQLSPEEQQKKIEQAIKQKEEWVETKARAGNFGLPSEALAKEGTPVMFVDDFESDVLRQASDFAKASSDTQDERIKDIPEIVKDEVENQQEDKPEKPIQENKEIIEEHDEILPIPQPTTLIPIPQEKKKIVHKQAPQKKTSATPQIKQATSKPNPSSSAPLSPRLQSAGKASKDRPLTLAQLTQGFLDHMKNEGTHAIHMLGKKNGRPSDEQIKYERYLQKLSWCLQNSYHINRHRFPSSAHLDDTVQVLLALNKDGSLKHCQVAKTSGNRELDNFTLFIFNDASNSFPPVPHYLPHDPFTITYVIMVAATEENRFKLYRQ